MILRSNLPKLREFGGRSARVLDAGGWYRPFNLATHVIDLNPYESRRVDDALDPEDDERFTADTWIVQDVCNSPWPFPDKTFDFVVCSHLLEDVHATRSPFAASCAGSGKPGTSRPRREFAKSSPRKSTFSPSTSLAIFRRSGFTIIAGLSKSRGPIFASPQKQRHCRQIGGITSPGVTSGAT